MTDNKPNHIIKNYFTEADVISMIMRTAERSNIKIVDETCIKLDHHHWLNVKEEWQEQYRLFLRFTINNELSGNLEVKYDNESQTNYLECELNHITNNQSLFNFGPHNYQLILKNNGDILETWSMYVSNSSRTKRLLSYQKINNKLVQTTSVIVTHSSSGLLKSSSLSPDKTLILNPNDDIEIVFTKMKLTYYMSAKPTLFQQIAGHRTLSKVLKDGNEKVKQYVDLLDMHTI